MIKTMINKPKTQKHSVDSETVCLWLVDHSIDRVIKILCCL